MVNLFRPLAHGLALLLLLAGAHVALASDEAAQKAKELKALQKEIEAERAELGRLNAQRGKQEQALRGIEQQLAEAGRKLHDLQQAKARQEAELAMLRARQEELAGLIAARRERLAASLRALYALGPHSSLTGLLSPASWADKTRMEVYLDLLQGRHAAMLTALREDMQESARLAAEREDALARLAAIEQSASEEKRQLEALRVQQAQAIAALDTRLQAGERRIQQMTEDRRALERLVARLEEAARRPPPKAPPKAPAQGREQADPPAASVRADGIPVKGRLLRRFGEPTGLGELRSEGHFFAAEEGSPVRAVADGRVVFADWMRGYGQLIILQHAGGYLSLYAHNESIYKAVGQGVRRGEVIAAVGRSGGARQAGLYFEVRRGGQPVNPARWAALAGP